MKRVAGDGEQDLTSFDTGELKSLYQKINTRLARGLLNGASLEDQKENIRMLNRICVELNRRKAFTGADHDPGKFMHS